MNRLYANDSERNVLVLRSPIRPEKLTFVRLAP